MQLRNIYQLGNVLSVTGGRAEENIAGVEEMVVSGRPRFCGIEGCMGVRGGKRYEGDKQVGQ